jgi:thiosulfate/3-mercaptopyruvate sulfurtransferase
MKNINRILVTAKWLNENLNNPDLIIFDASQKDNKAGLISDSQGLQIKNARIFDLKNSFSDLSSDLPNTLPSAQQFEKEARKLGVSKSSQIVVYDNLGIYSSPRVWWMFKAMGHDKIAVLDGGLPAWQAEGYETETISEMAYAPGDFTAVFNPETVNDVAFIETNLKEKEAIVIDARSEGRFKGTAPEPREGLPSGHIPNSINIPFQNVLNGAHYKSEEELHAIFNNMEVGTSPLVFSCGSGLTACIVLLAFELVNENPKSVYDGSWTEWAQSERLPIATIK